MEVATVQEPQDWTAGEEVAGVYVRGSDPLVYRYQCRCCGEEYRVMSSSANEPTLCHICTDAIPKERHRRAAARWVDDHG